MALKPITLRLDEEEYEHLKEHLNAFGDPDISVAYILRAYIRDLNRVLPYLLKSEWDLKNYFGLISLWLKQSTSMSATEMFSKMIINPWSYWQSPGAQGERRGDRTEDANRKEHRRPSPKEEDTTDE